MGLPSHDALARTSFVVSAVFLALLYGVGARAFGWFPNDVLVRAAEQLEPVARAVGFGRRPSVEDRVYDRSGVRVVDPAAVSPGLTLIPSLWEEFDWKPGLKLIDVQGRTLHAWEIDPVEIFPEAFFTPLSGLMSFTQPHGTHLFRDGDVLVNLSGSGIARLDACGRVEWRISGDFHHSVAWGDDGTFWASARKERRTADPFTGEGSDENDLLVRISADGRVLEEIEVFDVLRRNPALTRRYFQFHHPSDTHLNDVDPLPASMADEYPSFEAGDVLVSLKHLNLVFVLDPETLDVKWWVGNGFIQQHDPDFAGNGWIGIFDNNEDGRGRGSRFGGSRIVAFHPASDSMEVWAEPLEPRRPYTSNRGSWQALENGNLLITESNGGRVLEVDRDGRLVWEWIHPPYDETTVPVVYWAERYRIVRERLASWPCGTGAGRTAEVETLP